MDAIKSKLYHILQTEAERLGQSEMADIVGVHQSSISRAINNPENVRIDWFVKCLKKLGYKCIFTITPPEGE